MNSFLHFTVKHPRGIFPGKRVKTMFYFQDDLGPSASDVALQFVSESDTQMIVHMYSQYLQPQEETY